MTVREEGREGSFEFDPSVWSPRSSTTSSPQNFRTRFGVRPRRRPTSVVRPDAGFAGNDHLETNAVQTFETKRVTSFKTV